MIFKEMARSMPMEEIRKCMSILFDGSIITGITRKEVQNTIDVEFEIMTSSVRERYKVTLLPDSIEDLSEQVRVKVNGLYMYQQFMVARGYSEYWKDNIF